MSKLLVLLAFLCGGDLVFAAQSPYQFVKVQDRQLLVDDDKDGVYVPFLIKGVGYSPTPVGRYSDDWGYPSATDPRPKNLYDDPAVLNRDFALLKAMNANTIRFWKGNNTQVTFADTQNPRSPWYLRYSEIGRFPNYLTTRTFDLAHSYDLKIIAGFEMPWPGGWHCDTGASGPRYQRAVDFNDPYLRSEIISRFRNYVLAFKDHPALLFWAIGNENNLGFNHQTPQGKDQIRAYYSLVQEMAQEARLIEGPYYHPVAVVNGDLGYIGQDEYATADAQLSQIEIWGANVYRGASFGNLFSQFAALSQKAFWISEFGEDAWQAADPREPQSGREDQDIQASVGGGLWDEIKTASVGRQNIGATIMAYSDEWWKPYAWHCEIDADPLTTANGPGGCNLTQNFYGYGPQDNSCPKDGTVDWEPPSADKFFHEEWWGIMAIAKDARPGYPDIMTPRRIYTTLQQKFATGLESLAVTITSPGDNATVTGQSVAVTANAASHDGIAGVQFKLNDRDLGAEDRTAPYAVIWDSTQVANGSHLLSVVARDTRGFLKTATVRVTVANDSGLTAPVLNSVTAGNTKVVLNWTSVAGALDYTVRFGTAPEQRMFSAYSPEGTTATVSGLANGTTYYFTVVANNAIASSGESNEISATPQVLSSDPDFVVSALSAPGHLRAATTFFVNDTVQNQGGNSDVSFMTGYYLSTDPLITAADLRLGARVIPALRAAESNSAATLLMVPGTLAPGTYYFGAITDLMNSVGEQREDNNFALGHSVNITAAVEGVDLVVTTIGGPASAVSGSQLYLNDMLTNQGKTSAGSFDVSYYLSTDALITTSDTFVGKRSVGGLAVNRSSRGAPRITIPASLTAGTYYWGAIVDPANNQLEGDESNNAMTGNAVNIAPGADLIVNTLGGPASVASGSAVVLSDMVTNQGVGAVGPFVVGYYLSTDAVITPDDLLVKTRNVSGLGFGRSSRGGVNVVIPSSLAAGTYYWGAIVDYNNSQPESNEGNNVLSGGMLQITPGADLLVDLINGPESVARGGTAVLSDLVSNQGTAAVGGFVVGYYVSTDAVITTSDLLVKTRSVPALGKNRSHRGAVNIIVPASLAAGTYYWGVIADSSGQVPESNESNNSRAGRAFIVQ